MGGQGTATAVGLALGWAADQLLGDPRRWHPVAGFGRLAAAVEDRTYADDRLHGAVHVAVLVAGTAALGSLVSRSARHPVLATLATAAATWTVLGGRSLARESEAVAAHLDADDLAAARLQVSHLVSRDPQTLDADGVARAALESVAENTSDAVVAPLFWGAVAGIPGLLACRAINTLDAMVGYRNDRYRNFGWAAAKLDDLANLLPARVSGGLAILAAPGGRAASGRTASGARPVWPAPQPHRRRGRGSLRWRPGGHPGWPQHLRPRRGGPRRTGPRPRTVGGRPRPREPSGTGGLGRSCRP